LDKTLYKGYFFHVKKSLLNCGLNLLAFSSQASFQTISKRGRSRVS